VADLPCLSPEQKEVAKKLGISEDAYARSLLASKFGDERMRQRAHVLGEVIQVLLEKFGSEYRVEAVVADMFNGRWVVRVGFPRGDFDLRVPRELADDVLDSGQPSEVTKLKALVRTGISGIGDASR
jgi:hypothetical protein